MRNLIERWIHLLRDADPAWGLPLAAIGLVLMFLGWQIHKTAIPFLAVLVGLICGQLLLPKGHIGFIVGGVLGLVLAGLACYQIRHAVGILGGLAGAFGVAGYLGALKVTNLPDSVYWGAALFGFGAGTALAFVMFRQMAITVTSFAGSLLVLSGLNAALPQYIPSLYSTVSTFLADYPGFLVPFLVGGPTAIGTLTQLASADKTDAGAM